MLHLDDSKEREAEFPEFGTLEPEAADFNFDAEPVERAADDSDALFEAAAMPKPVEIELREIELAPAEPDAQPETAPAEEKVRQSFSWTGFLGGAAALAWLAAAIGLPISYYGLASLAQAHPAMQAGLVALAFGPAIMIWLSAAAVAEAAKAGKMAAELTKLARKAILPIEDSESAAKNITLHVRSEIADLNAAVDGAFARLEKLEGAASRHAKVFEETIAATREGADLFTETLVRERDAFAELNADLKGQTETLAHTVGRQVRLMREASKLVKTELGDAEEAFETHLASFRATASVLSERTLELNDAAQSASAASGRLDETMGAALDTLSEATKLTDAARQSTDAAVLAANTTANAVRETTQRAIGEAKRAAELIREETLAMQDAAAATLATLRDAADAARLASEDAQAAADKHANSIEKRLAAMAATATVGRKAETKASVEPQTLHEAAAAAVEQAPVRAKMGGLGSWSNVVPAKQAEFVEAPVANDERATFKPSADQLLVQSAFDLIADAGVLLDETLSARDLDQVAVASREGAIARRRAVLDCAPIAVTRIARFARRDAEAKAAAMAFRARPDLAKGAQGGSDVIKAYLLVDSALA
ncbi:MAG: hypothetical protein AB7O04_14090 [Hyphomonadaceae bacterium]